jgi:type IV pilus assembly protein PilO
MAKWNEMPWKYQVVVIAVLAVGLTCALYFLVFKSMEDSNRIKGEALAAKQAEVDQLRPYQGKLLELTHSIESLKQQLELQRRIVPDERLSEGFIQLMQGAASSAGIEVRRYTSKNIATKEYYTEVPFEIEVDGPYYAVLNFFEKVSSLERIVNVSEVKMATVAKPAPAKPKKAYAYAPGESVVATCVATTFFSHDATVVPPAKPGETATK